MSIKKVHLLLIDPQNDFCSPQGALYVGGAERDMSRVAAMINRCAEKLADVHVTLDQHHLLDVAHPMMWKGTNGKPPSPFTVISAADVENGVWTPVLPSLTRRMLAYVKGLEKSGRYPLCIWPPHCLIGSTGAAIVPEVGDALNTWVVKNTAVVDYVSKGSNIYTEHYSGVKAEVPDPEDPSTQLNTRLIQTLEEADEILLAGEAGSHCLANSVRDVANGFSDASYISKFTLLTDGTSPVGGFEKLQQDFVDEMVKRGMRLSTTVEVMQ